MRSQPRSTRVLSALAAVILCGATLGAQTPAHDPTAQLRAVLPADVADRVIARIADARARDLPAAALENRALKFAAKGVAPADIERSVGDQARRMGEARSAFAAAGRGRSASADEIEAGAEAMRKGVDGAEVSALARSAPSGRSLAVPLYVISGLVDRGLPADAALQRVQERLLARATDAELEGMQRSAVVAGDRRRGTTEGGTTSTTRERGTTTGGTGATGTTATRRGGTTTGGTATGVGGTRGGATGGTTTGATRTVPANGGSGRVRPQTPPPTTPAPRPRRP